MAKTPAVLILGTGPRVGAAVADNFAAKGYKVAVANRQGMNGKDAKGFHSFKADFCNPELIPALFDKASEALGQVPNVVVYNAAGMTPPLNQDAALSIPPDSMASDININVVSPYVAAQEAAKRWETLPQQMKKTFIYTGNALNTMVLPMPMMLTLGVGKAASAYWIGVCDAAYSGKGYRFFYADERHSDGKMKGKDLDGNSHAEFYAQLAEQPSDVPWHATFSKGVGYIKV